MKKIGDFDPLSGLDILDRNILNIVQSNNQLTHSEIGDRVGLSASAVRKRLRALRETGIIQRDVSILRPDPSRIQVIITITLASFTADAHRQIEQLIAETPEIITAYHISGQEDYVLIMSCESSSWYEAWSMEKLVADPLIGHFNTRIAWSCKKQETRIFLGV